MNTRLPFSLNSKVIAAYLIFLSLLSGLGLLLQGCTGKTEAEYFHTSQNSSPDSARSTAVMSVEYAEGFGITYYDTHKILEVINTSQGRKDTLRYLLIPRGKEVPKEFNSLQVIETPVRSMIVTSTTHLGMLQMLEAKDVLKGMAGAEYVYDKDIRNRIREGEILAFQQGELNKEEALVLNPDLIMITGGQASQFDNYRVLMESGIDIMVNSEWLETHPLGKAEWVKVMAALLGKEQMARGKFQQVEEEYLRLKDIAGKAQDRPLVINNLPYKGAWFVPGGNSFTARFLKDAQADYPWFDNESAGGLHLDYEVVYEAALEADIWLNPGAATSKEDILAKDSRFREFKSFKNGQIFNNNRRVHSSGGNDYWESGAVHPERTLADLIHIFHPGLLPVHELYYYRQIK